jgi:DEAD/DEAH box helicase domain-containing protein
MTDAHPSFDFDAFLREIRASRDYDGEIAHVAVFPAREARHADLAEPLPAPLARALAARGIERLYTHQVAAIERCLAGENVVVVTGTASGKTLCYNVPVLRRLLEDPASRALYLFPTKALAQDQLKGLLRLGEAAPELDAVLRAGTYDGDTTPNARRKLRDEGNLILTNPDMLHRSILPYHSKWHRFFTGLRYVVIDEIHSYRGIFGSNVAHVMRRLRRIARHYGAEPVFLASSATIRNPGELAERIVGLPFVVLDDDGSPRGARRFVFWNPGWTDRAKMERRSSNVQGRDLLVKLVERGVQTIVFGKARVVAELIYKYAREDLLRKKGALAARLAPYRGGYLPAERREIERRLFSGELLGVIATNALELGIDIGSLDASILVGFPGTIASVRQQAGRAGRGRNESLSIFVAYNDPVDQYLVRHPEYLLGASPEAAVVDPGNPYILASHLGCAAYELPLTREDEGLFGALHAPVADALLAERRLAEIDGRRYWSSTDFPAKGVNLRTISDDTYTIVDGSRESAVLGTVDAISAPELVYPEAIYLHEGESYFVKDLNLASKVATVVPIEADYYTQAVLDSSIRMGAERERRESGAETLCLGEATVTWATVAFKKIQFQSLDSIGYKTLDLPPQHLETASLWWSASDPLKARVRRAGENPMEGLVGIRNLFISLLPLFAMCDRMDVGGILDSGNLGRPTLFLYDRYPGGLGFVERLYERFEEILGAALRLVRECPCATGCPSCVGLPVLRPPIHHDPDTHAGWPIPSKAAAELLLAILVGAGSALEGTGRAADPGSQKADPGAPMVDPRAPTADPGTSMVAPG